MWNKLLPVFLSLSLLVFVNCSKESNDAETSQTELAQTSEATTESVEDELEEEMEFPIVQEVYVYDARGRRDPFLPLLVPEGEQAPGEERKIRVENLSLVGVMWGDGLRVAVLSDQAGNGYVFKPGDSLPGGKVVEVGEKSIVFELSQFGIVTKYEIVMEE
nr:MAG: hypothetical protein AM324_09995 [Candidatus Thorarchaeota archaeon SMTZ1-83]